MSHKNEIILASGSKARQAMLTQAGLKFKTIPSTINEELYSSPQAGDLALMLAQEKARDVSRKNPEALVIGSDQTLEFQDQIFSKAHSLEEAIRRLGSMRGKTHTLHSAVSIVLNEEILWSCQDKAHLTMNNLDTAFLESYINKEKDALLNCVGGYKIEGAGAWLFSNINGNFFTIMGMPLLPLLSYLREEHGCTL